MALSNECLIERCWEFAYSVCIWWILLSKVFYLRRCRDGGVESKDTLFVLFILPQNWFKKKIGWIVRRHLTMFIEWQTCFSILKFWSKYNWQPNKWRIIPSRYRKGSCWYCLIEGEDCQLAANSKWHLSWANGQWHLPDHNGRSKS